MWLLHQFRQAYELDSTEFGQFGSSPADRALRRKVQALDRVALGEAARLFATSHNVADRLERSTGLEAEVLPHPPQELSYRCESYGDFVLSVNRLDRAKRIDLLLEAAALDSSLEIVIVGEGPDRARLEELSSSAPLDGRVLFAGRVSEEELADLYGRCLAVYYAPVDEDFGMVPFEAFLSEKPVLTTTDAGGPLEVVSDRKTGLVVSPHAADLAQAATWLRTHRDEASAFGRAARRSQSRSRGAAQSRGCSSEGRVLFAVSSRAIRCRRLLGAARSRPSPVARPRRPAPGGERGLLGAWTSAPTTSGTTPTRTGGSIDALRRHPGVVILHDFVLHHLVAGMTIGHRDGHGYLDAMERDHGVVGRLLAHGVLDKRIPPLWESRPEEFPLASFVLQHATSLVVHSRTVAGLGARHRLRGPGRDRPASCLVGAGGGGGEAWGRARDRMLRGRQLE